MFTATSVFDFIINRPREDGDIPEYDQVQKVNSGLFVVMFDTSAGQIVYVIQRQRTQENSKQRKARNAVTFGGLRLSKLASTYNVRYKKTQVCVIAHCYVTSALTFCCYVDRS